MVRIQKFAERTPPNLQIERLRMEIAGSIEEHGIALQISKRRAQHAGGRAAVVKLAEAGRHVGRRQKTQGREAAQVVGQDLAIGVLVDGEMHLVAGEAGQRDCLAGAIAGGREHGVEDGLAQRLVARQRFDDRRNAGSADGLLNGDVAGDGVGHSFAVAQQFRDGQEIENSEQIDLQADAGFAGRGEQAVAHRQPGRQDAAGLHVVLHGGEQGEVTVQRLVDSLFCRGAQERRLNLVLEGGLVVSERGERHVE